MKITIDNTAFCGKKEILYGLNQAAKNARKFAFQEKAYAHSRIMQEDIKKLTEYSTSLNVYLDMVVRDSEFVNTVNYLISKDVLNTKNHLKEVSSEHGIIKPFEVFKESMIKIFQNKSVSKESRLSAMFLLSKLST